MSFEENHGSSSALRSRVFTVLTAALVLWPVDLIFKDSFSDFPLTLVSRFVVTFPLSAFGEWCFRVLPSALPVLGLIVATLVILREHL
jgi:hypothetical protein